MRVIPLPRVVQLILDSKTSSHPLHVFYFQNINVSERAQLKPSPRYYTPPSHTPSPQPPHIRFSPDLTAASTMPLATSEGLQGHGFGNKDFTVRGMMTAYELRYVHV